MRVHAIHGVLADWDATRLSHRLYLPRQAFVDGLRARSSRYVPVEQCAADEYALTVDDSTMAGAEASLVARELGHAVTLFLNPHQIATRTPYFFTLLFLAIDELVMRARRSDPTATWRSPRFVEMRTGARQELMGLSEPHRDIALDRILRRWKVERPIVPDALRPIDMDMLQRLVAAGVEIGNHGWSHTDIAALDAATLAADIARSRRWLGEASRQRVALYSVPFGLAVPPASVLALLDGPCMLLDAGRPGGVVGPGLVNREDVTDAMVAAWRGDADDATPRVVTLGSLWRRSRAARVAASGLAALLQMVSH